MSLKIDTQARIAAVRFQNQTGSPAAPTSGYSLLYLTTSGLYMETSGGAVIGPFVTGTSSAMEVIQSVTLTGSASTVDFTSIPATYSQLVIYYAGRSTTSASGLDTLLMRFNNDSGSNYDYDNVTLGGSASDTFGATSIRIGLLVQNSAGAGLSAGGQIVIPGYAMTTFNKTCYGQVSSKVGTSATNLRNEQNVGFWRDSSAINRITLLPGSNSILVSSMFTLYGIK